MKALGVLLAMVALAASSGVASAEAHQYVARAAVHAELRFPGSNGYRFEVEATARPRSRSTLFEIAAKNSPARVGYLVQGSLTSDGSIDVHLPHVGRIQLEFDPVHVTRRRPLLCEGDPNIVEHGYFRGAIDLRGERGYTTVNRSSARGRIVRYSRRVCKFRASTEGSSLDHMGAIRQWPALTSLTSGPKRGFRSFMVLSSGFGFNGDVPTFAATEFRLREGMGIFSGVSVEGRADDFPPPDVGEPKIVEVTPPAPFTGSATFALLSSKKSTWLGDLAVELPGIGRVPLAGRGFWSELCEGKHCAGTGAGAKHLGQIAISAG